MGFFNKFSFGDLFKNKESEEDTIQSTEKNNVVSLPSPIFEDTVEMSNIKQEINRLNNELKEKENEIRELKIDLNNYKRSYQSSCPHKELIENNKKIDSSLFNDYQFKCKHCSAELFNYQRSLNYINNLMDLLNKSAKLLESLKINSIFVNSAENVYDNINRLIKSLDNARAYMISVGNSKYDNSLKLRLLKSSLNNEIEEEF